MSAVPAVHCEARKVSYRQTKDGLVVSFVIHPQEMPDALAVAPLGQRYMLALAAIGDDEQPIPGAGAEADGRPHAAPTDASEGSSPSAGASMRSEQGKARYAAASDMERALVRACRMPKNEQFRKFAAKDAWGGGQMTEAEAGQYIRDVCCAGESRKLIAEDRDCYDAFVRMETSYLIEAGILAEPR